MIDDYGHNPTELRAALETARGRTEGRLIALYVPHVVERTRHLHGELGAALGVADVAIVTDFVGRRDAAREGVTARLVLGNVPDPTRRVWAPTLDDASRLALGLVRPGDVVVTLGVGEPWRAAGDRRGPFRRRRKGLEPMEIESGTPLARLTTIGTGGPATAFARPGSLAELEEALAWAAERGLGIVTVGLGSNMLAADEGVDALVLRLEGDLAAIELDGDVLRAGGGATNAVCLHRARAAGLGGLEFACAIPAPPVAASA